MSSGTAALMVALKSINLNKNDEVIISSLTIIACSNAVIFAGAKPRVADVDLNSYNITLDTIKSVYTKKNYINLFKNQFFNNQQRFKHDEIGYNFRLSKLQAAVAYAQFEYFEKLRDLRIKAALQYFDLLSGTELKLPLKKEGSNDAIFWMLSIAALCPKCFLKQEFTYPHLQIYPVNK